MKDQNSIETEGFYILTGGDPETGIYQTSYEFRGPFFFSDREAYEGFLDGLKDIMQYIEDGFAIETFEALNARDEAFLP